jgi:LmbE family N-acetylglucosaminyl deacetylase
VISDGGVGLIRLLRSLSAAGDVLLVGAHPDDEDNGLVALLAHGHNRRVVYWSATRGEAGQNRVGPYRGDDLGIYRTWESQHAREVDGGEALFGPFYDYDYSKHAAEALEKWGETAAVREIVRAIRIVQPQIVISRWRGDPSDGHGHHAAVGAVTKTAFAAAGDAGSFPELERVGLVPWQPRKLFQLMTGDWQPGEHIELGVLRPDLEGEGCVPVNTGDFDPLLGLTYQEQGALACNEHLTQGTGAVPSPGDFITYARLFDAAEGVGRSPDIFASLDASLTGLADYPGEGNDALRDGLERLKQLAVAATAHFRPDDPAPAGLELLKFVRVLGDLESELGALGLSAGAQASLRQYLGRKRAAAELAAAQCLGLRLEAALERAHLTPGESAGLVCRLWSYGTVEPTEISHSCEGNGRATVLRQVEDAGDASLAVFEVEIPEDAELSCPYWLRAEHGEYGYVWPEVPYAAQPFDPPLIEARCRVRIADHDLELRRAVLNPQTFVGGYRELAPSILPPISVQARTSLHFLRVQDAPQVLALQVGLLAHHTGSRVEGELEIHVPDGWTAEPTRADVAFEKAGDADSVPVQVTIPSNTPAGTYEIRLGIRCLGRLYDSSVTTVMQTAPGLGGEPDASTCVREQAVARPAAVKVGLIDVKVHEAHSHGYVTGTGDTIPDLLRSLGLSVRTLTDDELAYRQLDSFDTIVIGPNAFVVRDALRRNAQRLLEYVEAGGTLVVQYQGYPHQHLEATPYPFVYHQPHDRVTIEEAPVRIVEPDHFLLHYPNEIGPDDFDGWIRDRGMYFFGEWDDHYEPLLACADPGEDDKLGGLLVAGYGKGAYAYCAYSLFRQLAAGVPGGFRLFANLLAIPEARILRRAKLLSTVPLFEDLDDAHLHRVAEITTERLLADGEYVCREGDIGDEVYVVSSGALEVWRGDPEKKVGTSAPGAPIGELAALTGFTRAASLKAQGRTELFVVRSEDLHALLREEPDIAEGLLRLLARRLRDALPDAAAPTSEGTGVLVYE